MVMIIIISSSIMFISLIIMAIIIIMIIIAHVGILTRTSPTRISDRPLMCFTYLARG